VRVNGFLPGVGPRSAYRSSWLLWASWIGSLRNLMRGWVSSSEGPAQNGPTPTPPVPSLPHGPGGVVAVG